MKPIPSLTRKILYGLALGALLVSQIDKLAEAGMRFIPPPPPRTQSERSEDSYPESAFGVAPENARGRFSALEDDEGREIDIGQGRRASRSPAGLTVQGSDPSGNQRPALSRTSVSPVEVRRQEEVRDEYLNDLSDPVVRRKGVQEVSIIAGELGFFPKTIFVSRDVPVRMFVTGASKGSLCIMMDSFNVRKQLRSQKIEEISFVPNQPGTYRFYCPVNGSEGTMVVKELSSDAQVAGN